MKTRYKIGQPVWYVECYGYKKAHWYRAVRAKISRVEIEHWLPWSGKRKHVSVKYSVQFTKPELNKGHHQQNTNIFANRKNAAEYADLINQSIKLYPLPQNVRIPLTEKIIKKEKLVRQREPVESPIY